MEHRTLRRLSVLCAAALISLQPILSSCGEEPSGEIGGQTEEIMTEQTAVETKKPAVVVRTNTPASTGTDAPKALPTLIPDKYAGTFTSDGKWEWSGALEGPMAQYSGTLWVNGAVGAWARYDPDIAAVGMVRISAYIPGWSSSQDTNTEYVISHCGKEDRVYVDTSKYTEGNSGWHELGVYEFDGSDSEYVQLNRVSGSGNTRASTVRFEILNSADPNGAVWQTIYVGPAKESVKTMGMIALDRFHDLENCLYAYDIEVLASLGVIDGEGAFGPDEPVDVQTFIEWVSRAAGGTPAVSAPTIAGAADELYRLAKEGNRPIDWSGSCRDGMEFLTKAEILTGALAGVGKDQVLTRAEAASLVKRFRYAAVCAGPVGDGWTLTFDDEFNGAFDEKVWECENAAPGHILSTRWSENVEQRDGLLRLLTKKETKPAYPEKEWTTGSVKVRPEAFKQCYGYWEASMKLNAAPGLNNAFWMIDNSYEIDIVEAHFRNLVNTNLHVTRNGEKKTYSEAYHSPYDLSADFHVYACLWTKDELIYYFDGEEICRKVNYSTGTEVTPRLSSAVLNWAGRITDDADGCAMEVEWVRVWKQN